MKLKISPLILLVTLNAGNAAELSNIVLIVADNQSQTLLGTYGNSEILTPNIDWLAAEGARFDRAYAVSGVCSPTRAALMTGLLPSQMGVHVALPREPVHPFLKIWATGRGPSGLMVREGTTAWAAIDLPTGVRLSLRKQLRFTAVVSRLQLRKNR